MATNVPIAPLADDFAEGKPTVTMWAKKVGDRLKELANAGGGSKTVSIPGQFLGTASSVNTGQQIYPGFNGTLTTLTAWSSTNVASDVLVSLLKNGVAWCSVTIPAGTNHNSATGLSLAIASSDYLTATLSSSSSATNVGFRADFTLS